MGENLALSSSLFYVEPSRQQLASAVEGLDNGGGEGKGVGAAGRR
nr:hypothetical protein [Candidatus Freyrarchaeum guaymaensis]